jgi:hypothetical protein
LGNISKANNCSVGVSDALYRCGDDLRNCLSGCPDLE